MPATTPDISSRSSPAIKSRDRGTASKRRGSLERWWLARPPRVRGLIGIAAAGTLIGAFSSATAWIAVASVFILAMLGLIIPRLIARTLRATVVLPLTPARAGDRLLFRITLHNPLPFPVPNLILRSSSIEPARDDSQTHPISLHVGDIGSRTTREIEINLPVVRGVYPNDDLCIESGFPFDLRIARIKLECTAPLHVWPARVTAPPVRPRSSNDPSARAAVLSEQAGHWGESVGSRDYRPGDSIRHIHWKQSARYDRLIVRERQSLESRATSLRLELRGNFDDTHAIANAERAIETAAALIESWTERGLHVQLTIDQSHHDPIRITPPDGPAAVKKLLDALAAIRLRPSIDETGSTDDPTTNEAAIEMSRVQSSWRDVKSVDSSAVIVSDVRGVIP